MSKEIKFPLSKAQRTKFENDYELIFFKKPVHNISDEKLVEAVQANQSKIGSNAKNASPSLIGSPKLRIRFRCISISV